MSNFDAEWIGCVQGAYFVATGVWPLVSLKTFMAVTGPKVDGWLVKTVGLLIAVIGAVLLMASLREAITPESAVLAIASAAVLAAVDVYYVSVGRIARIYLFDAVAEGLLIVAWAIAIAL